MAERRAASEASESTGAGADCCLVKNFEAALAASWSLRWSRSISAFVRLLRCFLSLLFPIVSVHTLRNVVQRPPPSSRSLTIIPGIIQRKFIAGHSRVCLVSELHLELQVSWTL